MTEGPLSTTTVTNSFMKYPLKRLFFITIKDNSKKTKWMKIGKVNDWIRRYSTTYYIVRGTEGGTHFHLLAGIKPNHQPKPQKGIHFHFKSLGTKTEFDPVIDQMNREGRDQHIAEVEDNFEHLTQAVLTPVQQTQMQAICAAIHAYFKKVKQRSKRHANKTKKENTIISVLSYLDKNLNEPREDECMQYVDYINNT